MAWIHFAGASMAMAVAATTLLLALIHASVAATDDIVGCGGFVEASPALAKLRKPSDPKLDYSHITVKLHTIEGLVKDKTQCAPNGYYFLPVYEKGSFLLKVDGPPGWSFTPSQVPVIVDQNGCNGNEDINFHYTGFTLSGKIVGAAGGSSCKGAGDGPAGVKVSLTGPWDSKDSASVLTGPGGSYKFKNLLIGKYRLEASHPTLNVLSNGPQEVELGWGNGMVDDMFFVPGYTVEGSVLSQGNPVLGVQIFLHSNDVQELPCPQGPGQSPLSKRALCHATSDAEGKFKFLNVPCGDYTLVPFYKGENTVFDVSPGAIDISVGHKSLLVEEAFQVTGFSVGGRVVTSNGDGIENVKILVDNVGRATTDSIGFYKLDQVTSTTYTITASKEHYKFTSLKNFMVLPNMASIPNIEATHYDLCGSVHVLGQYGKRQVALTHGPANVKPQTKRVNDAGDFCFQVPPGEYRLSPLATSAEQQAGLLFSPQYLDVAVSAPVLDAVFTQAQVSVSGIVKCKSECSPRVAVSLVPSRPGTMQLDSSGRRLTHLTDSTNEFKFEKIFPGKYKLEVICEPSTESEKLDDEWCWEQKTIDVEVSTNDVKDLVFVQKGYWLRIEATHSTRAFTLQKNRDPVDPAPLQITQGGQQICIESPGMHELHFLWPCVFFGALSFPFDTSSPKPIHLVGQKFVLTGHIHVDSRLYPDANKLGNKLLVEIWDKKDGKIIDENNYARLVSEANETSPIAIYEYAHWAQLGDELMFSPRYASGEGQTSEQILLFYPKEQQVHVAVDGCQPKIPQFFGRPGVYITGNVVPPLEGVNIAVTSEKESKAGRLEAGDVAMQVVTGEDGTFVAGPLYDDTQYNVQAEKAGYHLRSIGGNNFQCQKLAQIAVSILPGEGAEDTLPSVLLSLSGDDGYRKNAAALPGGVFVFDNLFPGSFYLRPLLKEYSFSPAAQALELGSGETLQIAFTAQRTAYSIFGTVMSLSGKPEEGVYLEARSESGGYYEETVTDADGKYRLRGLLPNTVYNVKVVIKDDLGPSKLERASPSVYSIEVSSNDTTGVHFVVFEQSPTTILTGTVEGKDLERWQSHIALEVVSLRESQKVEREIPLALSYFFELQGLPRGKYLVRLVSKIPMQTHKFNSDVVEVDLETRGQVHVDSLKFYVDEHHQKQELAAAPVLPVIVGVAVIAVFVTMPSLKDVYQRAIGSTTAAASSKDIRKINPRKRTY